jgi:flagellar biosynthesis protein FlhG
MIAITSGKGGVGKSNISLNLSLYLAKKGFKTCLFDADFGLANINILLGLNPELNLRDLILGEKNLQDIIIEVEGGLHILPGSSGLEEMANLGADQIENLVEALSEMADYDFLIFDTSAGISRDVISLCLASPEIVLVITPEPTSLTDAFALLKVLTLNGFRRDINLAINQCQNSSVASLVYKKFRLAARKYLGINALAWGIVYHDGNVTKSVAHQEPFLSRYPDSSASKCVQRIGERLLRNDTLEQIDLVNMTGFWRRCLNLIHSPLKLPENKKKGSKLKERSLNQRDAPQPLKRSKTVKPSENEALSDQENAAAPVQGVSETQLSFFEQSCLMHLEKINKGVCSVSNELQQIRKSIEKLSHSEQ